MGTLNRKIKELQSQVRLYKRLSVCEPLTGLYNRRKLEEDLIRYIDLNKRHRVRFFILLIDINNFKQINDTKGHKTGDKILKETAKCLVKVTRKTDKIYRIGGDEFIVIFSHHKTTKFIKRIKDALKQINIEISIGYSDLKKNCLDIIDKKMYEDKRKKL